jgi:V/A-type H+-transporting ATPase subunit E
MAHTVQSFIDTLRADGVEAGRKAAEEIQRQAEQQAEQVIRQAEAKAQKILEEAEQNRQRTVERTRTDLELAARDTVAKLGGVLSQAVNRVLAQAASKTLEDTAFVKDLIREIACTYAQADAKGDRTIDLNVPESMRAKLADWIISTFHEESADNELSVELHGALASAGFEYKLSGGTVEVTPESVMQALSQLVSPQLQELIASSVNRSAAED